MKMTTTQLIKTPLSIKEAKSTYYPMWKHHHSDKIEVADQHPMTGTPEAIKEEFMQWALGWMDKVHDENGIANYDNLKALWRSGEGFENFEENAYTYSYAQAWSLLTARQKAELYLSEYEKVEEIAAYLSRGFSAYVNVDESTGEVDFALLTTGSRWNYDCDDRLTHIIPAFEGGSPEMVNDYFELVSNLEEAEINLKQEKDPNYGVSDYLDEKGDSVAKRQIELWVENFYAPDYEVEA